MKTIRIIIQGIIWIGALLLFWTSLYLFSHPQDKIVAFVSCFIFGIYVSAKLLEDAIKFGKWFDSHLKDKEDNK